MYHTIFLSLFIHILFSLLHFLDTKGQLFQRRQLNKSGILFIFSVPVSRSLLPRKASSSHLTLLPFPDNLGICHFIFVVLIVVGFTVFCLIVFLVGCLFFFAGCVFVLFDCLVFPLRTTASMFISLEQNFKFTCKG